MNKPTEAPSGLTAAEYLALALECLDQAGLSLVGQRRVQEEISRDARLIRALDAESVPT